MGKDKMKSVFGKICTVGLCMLPSAAVANPACPICTIAIGAGVGVAQKLGVPVAIVGLWAGALLTLLGYWLVKFFDKRGWKFWGRNALLIGLSVAMIAFAYVGDIDYSPQWYMGFIYIDPILFILVEKLYEWMKAKNGGHAHFPFEEGKKRWACTFSV